jgi:protein-tyrosine phosphatase
VIPLVDTHVHLLAGIDDGPRTREDALAMCRICHEEGIHMAAATAHQGGRWAEVTPERIREAAAVLGRQLAEAGIPLTVFATAEVMADPDTPEAWARGNLLSVGDRGQCLLVEMPHGVFVDFCPLATRLREHGVTLVLAHAERQPEWLGRVELVEELVRLGCLVQVSAGSLTREMSRGEERMLKSWFRRGLAHLLCSDGHSPRRRQPRMAAAYHQIVRWAGAAVADRICSTNGMAVLSGLPLRVPPPAARRSAWLLPFW